MAARRRSVVNAGVLRRVPAQSGGGLRRGRAGALPPASRGACRLGSYPFRIYNQPEYMRFLGASLGGLCGLDLPFKRCSNRSKAHLRSVRPCCGNIRAHYLSTNASDTGGLRGEDMRRLARLLRGLTLGQLITRRRRLGFVGRAWCPRLGLVAKSQLQKARAGLFRLGFLSGGNRYKAAIVSACMVAYYDVFCGFVSPATE